MSQKKHESQSSSRRWYFIGGGLLLAIALMVTFRNSGEPAVSSPVATATKKQAAVVKSSPPDLAPELAPERTARPLRRKANPVQAAEGKRFAQIENILGDSSLTTDQAAEQLLGIVQRTELSVDERLEAMAHGLNLSFKTFAPAAADPALPAPLAQRYIDELANRNETRQEQIEGCLALMGNVDEDIRNQAATQLAFYVEAEPLAGQPDELRKAAAEKIEKLKAEAGDQKPETGEPKKF